MSRWTIYGKDGVVKHESVTNYDNNGKQVWADKLEYKGTRMGERFLAVTVKAPYPIDFSIGDYIIYRGERFEINYDPAVIKKARRGTYGEGFSYDNIKFNSLADELVRCDFLDIVLPDSEADTNKIRYSVSPDVNAYCETVDDLLDRIQANLNELYGNGTWVILSPWKQRSIVRGATEQQWEEYFPSVQNNLPATAEGIDGYASDGTPEYEVTKQVISVINEKCWNALLLSYTTFKLTFIVKGRTIVVGSVGTEILQNFRYGKGNGLASIERTADSEQAVVTRLRAYGTGQNLPYRYYWYDQIVPYLFCSYFADDDERPFTFTWRFQSPSGGAYQVKEFRVHYPMSSAISPATGKPQPISRESCFDNLSKEWYWDHLSKDNDNDRNGTFWTLVYGLYYGGIVHEDDLQLIKAFDIKRIYLSDICELGRTGGDITEAYYCIMYRQWYDSTDVVEYPVHFLLVPQSADVVNEEWVDETYYKSDRVYVSSGVVDKTKWIPSQIEGTDDVMPDNLDILNLMLPGFPSQSLKEWVLAHGGTENNDGSITWEGHTAFFSDDKMRPHIDSLNSLRYGLRPQTVIFDGTDGKKEIFPTIAEVTVGDARTAGFDVNTWPDSQRIDEIFVTNDMLITDNGHDIGGGKVIDDEGNVTDMVKRFSVYIPYVGFDIRAAIKDAGADCQLSVIDGFLAGREFAIKDVSEVLSVSGIAGNVVRLDCERKEDTSISTWFPYKDYNFSNGDHFVLLGINLPPEYISMASVRLLRNALPWLEGNDTTKHLLKPTIDHIFMAYENKSAHEQNRSSLYDTIAEGMVMNIYDDDLGDMSLPIETLSIKENGDKGIPTYDVTLKDEKTVNNLQKTIDNAVTQAIKSGNAGYSSAQIRQMIEIYGADYFLSKISNDVAAGEITFAALTKFGNYVRNVLLGNSGAAITADGLGDFMNLVVRDMVNGSLAVEDLLSAARVIFSNYLGSAGAITGFLDGHGISMDALKGLIQTDGLEVRGFMRIMELIINKLQLMTSDYSFTESGKVEHISTNPETGELTLTMYKEHDNDITPLDVGDIVYGKVNDLLAHGTYYTTWMRITAKDSEHNTLTAVLYNGEDVPGGTNFSPKGSETNEDITDATNAWYEDGDYDIVLNITRHGNITNTQRQQAWVLSTTDKRLSFLWNVDAPIIQPYMYALCLGILPNLPNLPATRDPNMPSLYVDTIFYDHSHQANYPAKVVKEDRGQWTNNPTSEYDGVTVSEPYHKETFTYVTWLTYRNNPMYSSMTDSELRAKMLQEWKVDLETSRVWNYNVLWECMVDGTTQEPGFGCTDWKAISGGIFAMSIDCSLGELMAVGETNLLTCHVYYAQQDISAEATEWIIERESGDAASDAAWNAAAARNSRITFDSDDGCAYAEIYYTNGLDNDLRVDPTTFRVIARRNSTVLAQGVIEV